MSTLPKEMIIKYLDRRLEDLTLLQQSLAENSVKEFRRVGHQLLGNATSFGLNDIEVLANTMEELTLAQLQELGPKIIIEFSNWIEHNRKNFSA